MLLFIQSSLQLCHEEFDKCFFFLVNTFELCQIITWVQKA